MIDIEELRALIKFLNGEASLPGTIGGKWFGDHKVVTANRTTAFWWRERLPELTAALDELAALRLAQQWRGIESAPRDGTEIEVMLRPKVICLGWYWKKSSMTEGWYDQNGRKIKPTHWRPWQPLPGDSQ